MCDSLIMHLFGCRLVWNCSLRRCSWGSWRLAWCWIIAKIPWWSALVVVLINLSSLIFFIFSIILLIHNILTFLFNQAYPFNSLSNPSQNFTFFTCGRGLDLFACNRRMISSLHHIIRIRFILISILNNVKFLLYPIRDLLFSLIRKVIWSRVERFLNFPRILRIIIKSYL